jgi:glucosamine--fructose-6-phosphate aminotransferase (isomerizing)
MCGICGYLSANPANEAYPCVMAGLKMLQNRGYDSAGIAAIKNNELIVRKNASTSSETAIEQLEKLEDVFSGCSVAVGHTRWRTHGVISDVNSHPHVDYRGKFALVHNGIIENYLELKTELQAKGISFKSETDTEVIVNLLSYYYTELDSVKPALEQTLSRLEGTWGLVVICVDKPNAMYCARHGSPLLLGFGLNDEYIIVASEQSGFCGGKYINNYICLNDSDVVVIKRKGNRVVFRPTGDASEEESPKNRYKLNAITMDLGATTPHPYKHWMIKEIYEQPESVLRAMGMGGRLLGSDSVKLGGLNDYREQLLALNHLILLGCGTSYHAGLYAAPLFRMISGFDTVSVYDGGEFTIHEIPRSGKTGIVLISQSGETKDLHRCLEFLNQQSNVMTIGVINVVDSLISREVSCGVYLNCRRESSVAATKSLSSSIVVLTMMAIWFCQNRQLHAVKRSHLIRDLRRLPHDFEDTIKQTHNKCKDIAKYLHSKSTNTMFILGKGLSESIAREGALKVKEVSYWVCSAYNSSALKHGPYSLLDPEAQTPVIMICPDDEHFSRNQSIFEEVKSRQADLIGISDRPLVGYKFTIEIPKNESFRSLLAVVPLQLLAYELALCRNNQPDLPRGLAKTVTVF